MSFSITPYHNVDGSYVDDLLRMDMCENILLELRSGGDHGMYVYPKFLRDLASGHGYSHLGSVVWAGHGSVGFTPGAGRGSG